MFRVYSLLFCIVVCIERYVLWDWPEQDDAFAQTSFYAANALRFVCLLIPFVWTAFRGIRLSVQSLRSHLPFLMLGLLTLALPRAQPLYFCLFLVTVLPAAYLRDRTRVLVGAALCVAFLPYPDAYLSADPFVHRVRANMFALQAQLHIYAEATQGNYPASVLTLNKVAQQGQYEKDLKNPLTQNTGYRASYRDVSQATLQTLHTQKKQSSPVQPPYYLDIAGIRWLSIQPIYPDLAGEVLYYRTDRHHYAIYGVQRDGQHLLQDGWRGPLVLSNH